jgi:Tfp pilus assembly protein PilZ
MERRDSHRIGINIAASMFTKDGCFEAYLDNMSVGGLFLVTKETIEIGDTVDIVIPLPDKAGKNNITVKGIAVRIMGDGVAFKFQGINDNAKNALLHLSLSAQ